MVSSFAFGRQHYILIFPVTQGSFGIALHVLNPFRDPFEDIVSGFHRRLANLQAEAGHTNLLQDHEDKVKACQQKQVEKLRKFWKYVDCSARHATCKSTIQSGQDCGHWLLHSEEYQQWANSDTSSGFLLWVSGKRELSLLL